MRFRVVLAVVLLSMATSASAQQMVEGTPGRTYYELDKSKQRTGNFIIDFVNDPLVEKLAKEGRLFDDRVLLKEPVAFVYDSRTGRTYRKSDSFTEKRDPVDDSFIRTPEEGRPCNNPWSLLGTRGARSWGNDGPMHYGSGVENYAFGWCDGTVVTCLSNASGRTEMTRYSGVNLGGQQLVPSLCLFPNGDIALNYNGPPDRRPKFIIQGMSMWVDKEFEVHTFTGDAWSLIAPDGAGGSWDIAGREWMKQMLVEKNK